MVSLTYADARGEATMNAPIACVTEYWAFSTKHCDFVEFSTDKHPDTKPDKHPE